MNALCRLPEDGLVEIVPNWGTLRTRNQKLRPDAMARQELGCSKATPRPSGTLSAKLQICNPVTLRR
jgi:hypothetical protein